MTRKARRNEGIPKANGRDGTQIDDHLVINETLDPPQGLKHSSKPIG